MSESTVLPRAPDSFLSTDCCSFQRGRHNQILVGGSRFGRLRRRPPATDGAFHCQVRCPLHTSFVLPRNRYSYLTEWRVTMAESSRKACHSRSTTSLRDGRSMPMAATSSSSTLSSTGQPAEFSHPCSRSFSGATSRSPASSPLSHMVRLFSHRPKNFC